MKKWDLSKLYKSFEDEKFVNDQKKLNELINEIIKLEQGFNNYDHKEAKLVGYLNKEIELDNLAYRLLSFSSLVMSCDSTNMAAIKTMSAFRRELTKLTKVNTLFSQWLLKYPKIETDINNNDFLREHKFIIKEKIEHASHLLDDKTESLLAKLRQDGSSSWGRLQSLLTSTLAVDYEGKEITLSEVRNLASDANKDVRKKAYEAELEAYKKIEKPISFSLNSIKGEVNTISEERGYESALAQALSNSRMSAKTLEAMQSACLDYMDVFRTYLKRKATLLGHKNGLPFYDLFAPIGESNTKFTIDEANAYILKNFRTFSEGLYLMAKKAFEENWSDDLRVCEITGLFEKPVGRCDLEILFRGL